MVRIASAVTGAGLLAATALICSSTVAGGTPESPDYGAAAAGCDVTEPDAASAPGVPAVPGVEASEPRFISSQGLFVSFGERSTVAVPPRGGSAPGTTLATRRHGKIGAKILWRRDRRAWGTLRVKARSTPGREMARTRYTNHLGPESEAVPGGIIFPHEGCWKVTGKSGSATLRAVVWVVDLKADRDSPEGRRATSGAPGPLDCGEDKAGSKRALRKFVAILRRGDRQQIEAALATGGRFEWISVNDAKGPDLSVRNDAAGAAKAVARRGGLPVRIEQFQNAERPRPTTDFGFAGTWGGTRHLNGKAALDCVAGTARVLSVGIPP